MGGGGGRERGREGEREGERVDRVLHVSCHTRLCKLLRVSCRLLRVFHVTHFLSYTFMLHVYVVNLA